MKAFETHTGTAVVLPAANIDTDQILPARFLKKPRSADYSNFVFHDLRRDDAGELRPSFPFNRHDITPTILLAGPNFGCGSSREGAVYGLVDAGVRVVISTRIADIFHNNAVGNGLLPIELDALSMRRLVDLVSHGDGNELTVNLERQVIIDASGAETEFEVADSVRRRLLLGLDDITETIGLLDTIEAAERQYQARFPWSSLVRGRAQRQTGNR